MSVCPCCSSNRCSCHQKANGPLTCSSTKRVGRSYSVILEVMRKGSPKLAWVPSARLSFVHAVRSLAEPSLTVVGTNGVDVPPAYRLLVNLRGTAREGYRPFDGPEWTLAP